MHNRRNILLIMILIYGIAFIGCDDTEEQEVVQDEDACEHLTHGPSITLQARNNFHEALNTLAANDSFRIQAAPHTRYDVKLTQNYLSLWGGIIPYKPVGESGDYVLYMDKHPSVWIIDPQDTTHVLPEEVADHSDYCELIKYRGVYELDASITYLVYYEASIDSLVGTVFVKAEDDHDHDN